MLNRWVSIFTLAATMFLAGSGFAASVVRLYIEPGHISVRPDMQQKFKVYGLDMFDNEVPVTEPLTWSTQANAGTITSAGQFTAGTANGTFMQGVKVTTPSGLTGIAIVTVSSPPVSSGYVFERSWGDFVPGQSAEPTGIALGPNNTILVSDPVTYSIQQYDTQGRYVSTIGPKLPFQDQLWYSRAIATSGNTIYVGGYGDMASINDQGLIIARWDCPEANFTYINGLAVAKDGSIFATDPVSSRVTKMSASGAYLLSFGGLGTGDGQLTQPSRICIAPNGSVYVVDGYGLNKFDQAGRFLAKWTKGPSLETIYPSAVAADPSGNIYLWDSQARFYRINASDGQMIRINISVTTMASGMVVDADGNICVLSVSNSGSCVRKFSPQGVFLAEWGNMRPGCLRYPGGVTVSPDGVVYVADTFNQCVQTFDTSGNSINSWSVYNAAVPGFDVGYPRYIKLDSQGGVYVSHTKGAGKYTSSGTPVKHYALPSSVSEREDGYGLALGLGGDLFLSICSSSIFKYNANGELVTQWGTEGSGDGQLSHGMGLSTDAAGNVYVAELGNNRVQKFSPAGSFISKWATGAVTQPLGVTNASDGSFFVAGSNTVQKYSATGILLGTWGGVGWNAGQFCSPSDVSIDKLGNFYVADRANNRICKYAAFQQTLSKAKELKDGEFIALTNQTVTATVVDMGDCLYIESADRSCGIRVTGVTSGRGYNVALTGVLATVNGERTIKASSVTVSSFTPLTPLTMTNKALGGGDASYDPQTGIGQRGVEDGAGANNIGLLVKTTGKVTGVGSDFFYIDDGTHAHDGSIFVGVRVQCRKLVKPKVGQNVTVTGISRINKIGDRYFRSIAARIQSDIVAAQ